MSRLVLFMRKSMGGVCRGVKACSKKSIVCQSCNANTVHVKIRVVVKLLVMQEIKCAGCQEVTFSTINPSIRTAPGQTGPESPEPPPLRRQRTMSSENGDNRYPWDYEGPNERPISYTTSINQADKTLSQSRSQSQSSLNKSPRESYGDRSSASFNEGSNEYFEDQCSNAGQYSNRSTRSSYGPVRKPSLPHTDYRLDLCGIGAGESGTSLACAQRPISLSDTGSIEEKSIKENQRIALADLEKAEGHRTFPVLDNRGSVSSTDLTIGNFEPRRRSDYSAHRHSSLVELEIERHPGPILAPSSDKSIRSTTPDKRPGRRNLTHLHRAAVSRSFIQKIEQQDEQEQQHQAEKNNAKRRSSLTSDFEGLPTEEDVRRARQIWNDAQKKNSPHYRDDHDVQWAKNTLRALANWEKLRLNHPHTRSVEQLHLRSVGSFESSMPTFYPDMDIARHHQPFVPQVMSPRLSLLSLQPLPTPVKEEPEGDSQDGKLDETYSPLYHSSELSANPPARRAGQIPVPRLDEISIRQAEAEIMSTPKEELDSKVNKRKLFIGRTIASKSLLPGYKKVNKRCIKAFKSITEKVLPQSVLSPSPSHPRPPPVPGLPLPSSVTPTSPPQPIDTSTVEAQEEHAQVEPRSFGVIHDFMANEEERRHAEGEISASVGLARMPLVEMRVQLRHDIFARLPT